MEWKKKRNGNDKYLLQFRLSAALQYQLECEVFVMRAIRKEVNCGTFYWMNEVTFCDSMDCRWRRVFFRNEAPTNALQVVKFLLLLTRKILWRTQPWKFPNSKEKALIIVRSITFQFFVAFFFAFHFIQAVINRNFTIQSTHCASRKCVMNDCLSSLAYLSNNILDLSR